MTVYSALLAPPFLLPALWRLWYGAPVTLSGLLSDLGSGMIVFALAWQSPRWLRMVPLLFWALLQAAALELYEAMRRLPDWQDLHYLCDPVFLHSSMGGVHLASPGFTAAIVITSLLAAVMPTRRPTGKVFTGFLLVTLLTIGAYGLTSPDGDDRELAARYNPLHWLVSNGYSLVTAEAHSAGFADELPLSLTDSDLRGRKLLGADKGKARNVLIIALEGISGIYLPEIRGNMGVTRPDLEMEHLAGETAGAMLVPDFVTHNHQTIRGLYSILCGDFSKFSFTTPKAFELQGNPQRARQCLPAQLAGHGWQTHYLQGAPLQFMNKDRVMPMIGFQQTHGMEWFPERPPDGFVWGPTDDEFFHGARDYIHGLQTTGQPWFLSLLTVGTHQPYAAPDELVAEYGSRKLAAVAQLDKAVAGFLRNLRRYGVLEDTLVFITSDESHGASGADWYCSWGLAAILAPEHDRLPRIKRGTYGLVDVEASILDYLGLPLPRDILGRSLFRDYDSGRDMISSTAGKLRRQTADRLLYECSRSGDCQVRTDSGIIGPRHRQGHAASSEQSAQLPILAQRLDAGLQQRETDTILQFARGEVRKLPPRVASEWADNLIGAQYLDFPENSRVDVDIRLHALSVQEAGVQLRLSLRQFEQEVKSISHPPFPLLHSGEQCHITFSFTNREARQAFSFHLVGAGRDSSIRFDSFSVTVRRLKGPDRG